MPEPTNRPRIGDFRSKPDNAPRTNTPAAASLPDAAPVVETKPADAGTPKELTPAALYAQRLEEAKIPKALANAIFDAVITKGYYEEFVKVGQSRAVLRTRLYDDHLRLQSALEATRPGLVITQEDMITRYNLAASLYEWKGETFKHEGDDDFDKVLKVIKALPGPVYSLLAQRLAEFDRKVMLIFSDGASDSF